MNKLHLFSRSGSKAIKVSKTNEVAMFKLQSFLQLFMACQVRRRNIDEFLPHESSACQIVF